ncbi:hypothetical protein [Duganella sp. FT27W]|uniref:hypothetical protein n=1 Tax=Duganella sp. FT27W TaxID=2654636 RepID=UPI00128D8765|nr:hypothetical protein [Duganella sp. FT27W]MPQ56256.1 hypothetical protein [Duganella sp. FT27W]
MGNRYEFSLYFSVDDLKQLLAAALAHEDAEGMTAVDFTTAEGEIDVSACARMLLDPGSMPGCNIFDSAVEGEA